MEVGVRVRINGQNWASAGFDKGFDDQRSERSFADAAFSGYRQRCTHLSILSTVQIVNFDETVQTPSYKKIIHNRMRGSKITWPPCNS
jgi:hypothetical protein